MTFGLKTRLFLISLALIAAVGAASSVYLEFELRRWLENKTGDDLVKLAKTYLVGIDGAILERADVRRLHQETGMHVWFVNEQRQDRMGSRPMDSRLVDVLSRVSYDRESVQLERNEQGEISALFAFVPIQYKGKTWLMVFEHGPKSIIDTLSRMRFLLIISSAIALIVSSILAFVAVRILSRRLKSILSRARAAIDEQRPDEPQANQELQVLHENIDRLDLALEDMLKTLARERYRFEAVLESIREAVFAVNEYGLIVLTNRAAKKLIPKGTTPIGKKINDIIDHPELKAAVESGLSGEAADLEFELERKKTRYILGQVTPHLSEGGAVIVLRDVTKLRRLESLRRDFVANVSHELRTPVSVIRLNAEALRDGALKDEKNAPRFVDATLRHAERLSNLVSDLLDISRIESGRYQETEGWMDLQSFVTNLVEDMRPLASERDVSLSVGDLQSVEVLVDTKALEQVLTNLVQNAVKYAHEAGVSVKVQTQVKKKNVTVSVCDEGPGIPTEHHDRIFERFYRVDAGRSKHMGGTGLGLSIVKHLVAAMGGTVGLYSNEPQGTVFWFTLPKFRQPTNGDQI